MNTTATLIDDDLAVMLARRGGDRVPPDLVPSICAAVADAPSRPRPLRSLLTPPPMSAPALRVTWVVVAVGLLLAATVSAVLVGGEILRRSSDLSIVPPSEIPVA